MRADRVVAGVVFMLFGGAFLLDDLGLWRFDLVLIWPICLVALGVAVILGRANRARLDESRRAQLAVAEERVRIARDLHDIVAHAVSIMTIQIAAARRVARTKPDAADEALQAAEDAGRRSLAELRDLVSVLRSADDSLGAVDPRQDAGDEQDDDGRDAPLEPLPGLADIDPLVEQLRGAGLDISLDDRGHGPVDPTPRTALTAYRIVQEALTNVLRHAGPGTHVDVRISNDGADLTVEVADEGTDAPPTPPASGQHGLVGMRERAAAAGGRLSAGPRVDRRGWRVEAVLPLNGQR